ncbi:hypothetical protein KY284_019969 [Solanum tuberosum]|nr:hypothetical protein KY284_019969 [Solanum tuberosum]
MLVGGDLGFLSSLVVAAFMPVFGPVSGFMVRRKWRCSVARRDEIKRLLVLASEEAARVELHAAEEYGYDYGYRCESLKEEDEVFVETPASSAPPPTISISYSGGRSVNKRLTGASFVVSKMGGIEGTTAMSDARMGNMIFESILEEGVFRFDCYADDRNAAFPSISFVDPKVRETPLMSIHKGIRLWGG